MKLRKLTVFLLLFAAQSNTFAQSADLAVHHSASDVSTKSVEKTDKAASKKPVKQVEKTDKAAVKTTVKQVEKTDKAAAKTPANQVEKTDKTAIKTPINQVEKTDKAAVKTTINQSEKSDKAAVKTTANQVEKSDKTVVKTTANQVEKTASDKPVVVPKNAAPPSVSPLKDSERRAGNPISETAIVQNASVLNGDKDDFSPVFFENGLLFCSNSRKLAKNADKSTVVDDLNLKFATFDSVGNLSKPKAFSRKTNSKTHEGPSCFSSKGDTMFLTRVMSKGGIAKMTKDGETTLKIYIKTRDAEGNFTGEAVMPFESENYSYCHPTLSADGQRLYFSSNMPGGFGGMDLWMTRKLKNGEWSQAMNLGARINSGGNELFPHITTTGAFYFSSNGRKENKGGLDIYRVDIENKIARVFPMSESFNTDGDDFGIMFLPSNEHKGYFSSNRKGGSGGDDIYVFELK